MDQSIKYLVALTCKELEIKNLIPNSVDLIYAHNPGSSFSIFNNNLFVLIFVSIALISALSFALFIHRYKHPLTVYSVVLIIAGGIGNLIDRLSLGYVIDMFRVKFLYIPTDTDLVLYPVFNLADIFIFGGTITFLLSGLLLEKRKRIRVKTRKEELHAPSTIYDSEMEGGIASSLSEIHPNHYP